MSSSNNQEDMAVVRKELLSYSEDMNVQTTDIPLKMPAYVKGLQELLYTV